MRPGIVDTVAHPITDPAYAHACRERLDEDGALVLRGFFTPESIAAVVEESSHREADAFYASSTHNVYLTDLDPALPDDHPFNRQVASSKGLIADDQVPVGSALRAVYDDPAFRSFLSGVLGIGSIHPYADDLSSINVHFAAQGMELGWHFDNSSFAVTMLLQAPESGGDFQFVPSARDSASGDQGFERVGAVLDGRAAVHTLEFEPGDLVMFRGRDALHRITPTEGDITRMLVVFAYNAEPGIALSDSARTTFFGR